MANPYRDLIQRLADELQEYINYAPIGPCDQEQALVNEALALLDQPVAEGLTDEDLEDLAEVMNVSGNPVPAMRRALELWGRPTPQPPAAGEVAGLVEWLRIHVSLLDSGDFPASAAKIARAADLLQRQHPQPVPVSERMPGAQNIFFEFSVFDSEYEEQAGGSAPTYAQAISEGMRYLAMYQQAQPHTLELRRVEVMHPEALPTPEATNA